MNDQQKIQEDVVLLLTATITPNSYDTLALTDPEVRRNQYIDSLNYYLQNTTYKIVFAENSGESLSKYFMPYTHRIEFLTYVSKAEMHDRGKGFKEIEIINFAMANSCFISHSALIVKITGRLNVLNISKLLLWSHELFRQHKKIIACNIYKRSKMDSRNFIFSKDFWSYMQLRGIKIDLKYSFENALWDSVSDYFTHKKGVFRQFPEPLRINGISGGFGTTYYDTDFIYLIKKIKHKVLAPFRKLS